MKRSPRARLAWLALTLLPLWFVGPSLFGERAFLPFDLARFPPTSLTLDDAQRARLEAEQGNLDASDVLVMLLPEVSLARAALARGELPAWNPGARFGAPLFPNAMIGLLCPFNWPLLVLDDVGAALALAAWLALAVAGLTLFGFLREVGASVPAALLGAVVFTCGGTMLANVHFFPRMNALAALPGLMLFTTRLLAPRRRREPGRAGGPREAPESRGIDATRGAGVTPVLEGQEEGPGHTPAPCRGGDVLGLAAFAFLAWVSGFPPYAAVGTMVAGAWAVVLTVRRGRSPSPREAWSRAGVWLGALVLGLGLAAAQLVPMLLFYPATHRDLAPEPDVFAREAFDPMGLLGLLLPTPFGHPAPDRGPGYEVSPFAWALYSRTSWEDGRSLVPHNYDPTEYMVFPGTLALLLAGVGLFGRRLLARFAGVTLLVVVVVGAGPGVLAPLFGLPGVQSLQPMRWMGVSGLLLASLAALGFDRLGAPGGRRVALAAAVAAGLLLAACLGLAAWVDGEGLDLGATIAASYRDRLPQLTPEDVRGFLGEGLELGRAWMSRQAREAALALGMAGALLGAWSLLGRRRAALTACGLGAVAFTLVELLHVADGIVVDVTPADVEPTAVHGFLAEEHRRLAPVGGLTIGRAASYPRIPSDLPIGSLYGDGIRDLHVFTFVDAWSHRLFGEVWGEGQLAHRFWPQALPDDERLGLPLLDLLGVRLLLSSEALEHAGTPVGPVVQGPAGSFTVYERPGALARAFVVPALEVQPDEDAVIARLCAPDLDPRAAVVVDPSAARVLGDEPDDLPGDMPDDLSGNLPGASSGDGSGAGGAGQDRAPREVRFAADTAEEVVLEVGPGAAGFLVLADAWFPGWQVELDGEPASMARGNLFMRVVRVPSGGCTVRFAYTTPGLAAGVGGSLASLVLLSLLVAWLRARRRGGRAASA